MPTPVSETPAAPAEQALAHFEHRRAVETDCWDVRASFEAGRPDFVLLDVRSTALYAAGHVPGAINLPYGKITARRMEAWPEDMLLVVYCAGPHCNGACKAAIRLARLGRPVKEMIGGIEGWKDEGFALVTD